MQTKHTISSNTIYTDYEYDRDFWGLEPFYAILDSYDPSPIYYDDTPYNPIGYGHTEQQAIDDLLNQLED